ncbi:MAG TPA: hypothetical protein VFN71_10195 [Methylomirabilota bacterium]|nr:hypothetical protein [Methylomirabilota bacterium]
MTDLFVGTVGEGLWRSADGEDWLRVPRMPADAPIYSLAPGAGVLAGSRGCLYRNVGGGWAGRWVRLPLPDASLEAWAVAADPGRPSTLLVGCRPLALLRSDDGGLHWTALPFGLPPGTERPHTPRVTTILAESDALWCGVEVGGVFVSRDAGAHWTAVNDGLPSLDIHALGRVEALLAATPRGIARLDGAWRAADFQAPWTYCRALAALPGRPGEWLCGAGDGPPGTQGAVMRSEDDGRTWRPALVPGAAASTIWSVAVSPDDPDVALAGAIKGEVFLSEDGGSTWRRLARAFGEIRGVLIS